MFLRKSIRRYKGKVYTNYMLVESVHTAKGPRQKVICSLGDLSPRPAKEWLALAHRVEDALLGQKGLLDESDAEVAEIVRRVRQRQARGKPSTTSASAGDDGDEDLVTIHGDRVGVEEPRSAGAVHVGHQFWKRLGLEEILGGLEFSSRAVELTCAMVLNRLVAPKSEHAMPNWIRSTAVGDLLGVDFAELTDAPLYRNLDRLHPNRVAIERALAARERSLFNLDPTIFFYDLTSTYFEGQALANPKARRGYSRDKRPDCKQVVVGLAVGKEGFPLAHEVYAGNTQDRQTLPSMLDSLEKRVGAIEGDDGGGGPRHGLCGEPGGDSPPGVALRGGGAATGAGPVARGIRAGGRIRGSPSPAIAAEPVSEEIDGPRETHCGGDGAVDSL